MDGVFFSKKIIIFDLLRLTVNVQVAQYSDF